MLLPGNAAAGERRQGMLPAWRWLVAPVAVAVARLAAGILAAAAVPAVGAGAGHIPLAVAVLRHLAGLVVMMRAVVVNVGPFRGYHIFPPVRSVPLRPAPIRQPDPPCQQALYSFNPPGASAKPPAAASPTGWPAIHPSPRRQPASGRFRRPPPCARKSPKIRRHTPLTAGTSVRYHQTRMRQPARRTGEQLPQPPSATTPKTRTRAQSHRRTQQLPTHRIRSVALYPRHATIGENLSG